MNYSHGIMKNSAGVGTSTRDTEDLRKSNKSTNLRQNRENNATLDSSLRATNFQIKPLMN